MSTYKEKILALMADEEWRTNAEICAAIKNPSASSIISSLATAGKLIRRREDDKKLYYQFAKPKIMQTRTGLPPMIPLRQPKQPVAALLRSPTAVSPTERAEAIRRRLIAEAKLYGGVVDMQVTKQAENLSNTMLQQFAVMITQLPGCDWHFIMTGEML
jgi:hypothetical protein